MTTYSGDVLAPYNLHERISANSATLGPTAPSGATIGTARGLQFAADNESVNFQFEVPESWDGASDIRFRVYWVPESGDAIADTETVKWDLQYRSIDEGEAVDNGTAVTATTTYTQSGAGTDKEFIVSDIVIDFDNVNQPVEAGDIIVAQFDRDVSGDTYSGDPIVLRWEINVTATGLE